MNRRCITERGPDDKRIDAEAMRTFPVDPKHEVLSSGAVQFNVETVSAAAPLQPAGKPLEELNALAAQFYQSDSGPFRSGQSLKPRVEANSTVDDLRVAPNGNGFATACITAFAGHHPLILRADDLWSVICNGFGKHVVKHSEALREHFVQHAGKKELHVQADHLVMGETPAQVWEQTVFPKFSEQIREHIGERVHEALASPFTTSSAVDLAASQIALMAAMKNYFAYSMSTCCGVPWVRLEGTLSDWQALRERTAALRPLMLPEFAEWWLTRSLLPVLDQFVAAHQGQVDHCFWQHMVKVRQHGRGSGSHTAISGWLACFFPYLKSDRARLAPDLESGSRRGSTAGALDGCSRWVKPWQDLTQPEAGPLPEELPSLLSSAPVRWDYFGCVHEVHFHAGSVGLRCEGEALRPATAWLITHDLPTTPEAKLVRLRELEAALAKAHTPDKPPYQLRQLRQEIQQLEMASAAGGMAA